MQCKLPDSYIAAFFVKINSTIILILSRTEIWELPAVQRTQPITIGQNFLNNLFPIATMFEWLTTTNPTWIMQGQISLSLSAHLILTISMILVVRAQSFTLVYIEIHIFCFFKRTDKNVTTIYLQTILLLTEANILKNYQFIGETYLRTKKRKKREYQINYSLHNTIDVESDL